MDTTKLQQLQEAILAGNVPQIVLATISNALEMRASDIHIEPERSTTQIRYRVDGVLRRAVEYPPNMHPAVVSRIKIMSNLKIDEQRIPQDGRTAVTTKDNREMDLRVSSLPTVNGEKIVMRIQDKSRKIPTLDELGIEGNSGKFLKKALELPNGIVLTTGPTGSGKTTTLYACMSILNTVDVNILTIEDPVEIQLDGMNQSQVHPDINYTFANGLRTALRQDPDIIMVGEIRDRETMDTAIEASLTGHLVFSTIHTNSAVETLTRIANMGIPPYLMGETINLIMAQRLVRRVCDKCRQEDKVAPEMLKRVKRALKFLHADEAAQYDANLFKNLKFFTGKGCEQCGNTGYFGRVGIYEGLWMTNKLRRLILDGASSMEIERTALESGMVGLEQAGIIKALKGETTLEEVYSVARESEVEEADAENENKPKDVTPQAVPTASTQSAPSQAPTQVVTPAQAVGTTQIAPTQIIAPQTVIAQPPTPVAAEIQPVAATPLQPYINTQSVSPN